MKRKESVNHHISDEDTYMKPSSAQDCTGLIPAAPADHDELENYEELYPFLPQIPDASKFKASGREK